MRVAFPPHPDGAPRGASRAILVLVLAAALAYEPAYAELGDPARDALFVLLLAAGWWTTRAVPPFAVSLAVIALQVALLGSPTTATDATSWQRFVAPWASPVMWLFLGGLLLAAAMATSGLDRRVADRLIAPARGVPRRLLRRVMAVAFGFSAVMSNTAATALMLVLVRPFVGDGEGDDTAPRRGTASRVAAPASLAAALLLGIPVAANLGGMSTVIGTPPNAIAVAALTDVRPLDFALWLVVGLPPALLLLGGAYVALARDLPRGATPVLAHDAHGANNPHTPDAPVATTPLSPAERRVAVVLVLTLLAWLTERWHGVPTAVVAVVPVAILSLTGDITEREVRSLPWDVLVLIAGGLSLGVGVGETGLTDWIVARVVPDGMPIAGIAALLAAIGWLLSTFISNTAAATMLVPLALAAAGGAAADGAALVLPTALVMSTAMALPVSTPPNALVFATGRLDPDVLRRFALRLGAVAVPLVVLWSVLVVRLLPAP